MKQYKDLTLSVQNTTKMLRKELLQKRYAYAALTCEINLK